MIYNKRHKYIYEMIILLALKLIIRNREYIFIYMSTDERSSIKKTCKAFKSTCKFDNDLDSLSIASLLLQNQLTCDKAI